MSDKKKRCYIYTRVSTGIQIEGFSLDAQKDRLIKEANHREMVVVEHFSDEGKSGKNTTGRPQFTEMLRRIENGNEDKVDYVLVFKLSRFGRNAADVLYNLQIMQDYGVNLLSVEESIDSAGAAGKLMISVIAAVAEIERENIRAQTMAGRIQKAREGKWNGGQAPFGYSIDKESGILVIDEKEAKIVRLIYDRFLYHDAGISGVAKFLNDSGYRKVIRGNGKYNLFSTHFVRRILDNPVYIGKIAYGRRATEKITGTRNEYHMVKQDKYEIYDGKHEAIISQEDWEEVRRRRSETGKRYEKKHNLEHEHILSSVLKCPVCGSGMYGTVNRKRKKDGTFYPPNWYYVCKHRHLVNGEVCTFRRQPPQEPINAEVLAITAEVYKSPWFVASMQEVMNEQTDADTINDRIEQLQKSMEQYIGRKNKLAEQIDQLDVTDPLYDKMYDDLNRRLRNLYNEIAGTDLLIQEAKADLDKVYAAKATIETAYAELELMGEKFPTMADADKKALIGAIVERVEIFPERQPDGRWVKAIKFQFPVLLAEEEPTEWWYAENSVETVVLITNTENI